MKSNGQPSPIRSELLWLLERFGEADARLIGNPREQDRDDCQPDPDDELIGLQQLIDDGMDTGTARQVMGAHSALARWEVLERLEMLRRERGHL